MTDKLLGSEVKAAVQRYIEGTASERDSRIFKIYQKKVQRLGGEHVAINRWMAANSVPEDAVDEPATDSTPLPFPSISTPLDKRMQMLQEASQRPVILMDVPEAQVTPPSRPTVHEWALGLALAVSARADCTRRQVGAVILDDENRVISTGYNGYPAGTPGCLTEGACLRGRLSYAQVPADSPYVGTDAPCGALHAEENAVLYARRSLWGCTIYITHKPCPNCERLLKGTGLHLAVWPGGQMDLPSGKTIES